MVLKKVELDQIKAVVEEIIDAKINDKFKQGIIDSVANSFRDIIEKKIGKLDQTVSTLSAELSKMKADNSRLKRSLDDQEQFSRNLNIRIFGMPYSEGENLRESVLELFLTKLKCKIVDSDIKNVHRVYAKNANNDKPPAVLVAFREVNNRSLVLQQRKLLKSSGLVIKEDLTKLRLALISAASLKFDQKSVWCLHGNVYVKVNGVVHRVDDEEALKDIQKP